MTKSEFLSALNAKLDIISADDRKKAITFFDECIDDRVEEGMSVEEAIASLGGVDEVVRSVIENTEQPFASSNVSGMQSMTFTLEEVDKISVDDKSARLILGVSGDDLIHVSFREDSQKKYQFEKKGTEISFTSEVKWFALFSFKNYCFEIMLPKNANCKLDLKTANGEVSCNGVAVTEAVKMRTGNGNFIIKGCEFGATELRTSNGAIIVEGLKAESLYGQSKNGRIEYSEIDLTGDCVGNTSNGAVDFRRVNARDIVGETDNSGMSFDKVISGGVLKMRSANGKIAVDAINAEKRIEIHSSNGAIKGTIDDSRQNYTIESHTSNGGNTLGAGGYGEKKMKVTTSNGKIDINFLKP